MWAYRVEKFYVLGNPEQITNAKHAKRLRWAGIVTVLTDERVTSEPSRCDELMVKEYKAYYRHANATGEYGMFSSS